jgi:Peptidase inhibitor family I36
MNLGTRAHALQERPPAQQAPAHHERTDMSRTWRWRTLSAVATGAMALVAVSLGGPLAATASAATPTAATPTAVTQLVPPCGQGGGPNKFEVFDNPNFSGACQDATKAVPDESDPVFNFNDKLSSVVNNTDTEMCLFVDSNFGSISFRSEPHTKLASIGDPFNNSISSIEPCP